MSTPDRLVGQTGVVEHALDLADRVLHQPGGRRDRAAQAEHAGPAVVLGQPGRVELVVPGGRAEVPQRRARRPGSAARSGSSCRRARRRSRSGWCSGCCRSRRAGTRRSSLASSDCLGPGQPVARAAGRSRPALVVDAHVPGRRRAARASRRRHSRAPAEPVVDGDVLRRERRARTRAACWSSRIAKSSSTRPAAHAAPAPAARSPRPPASARRARARRGEAEVEVLAQQDRRERRGVVQVHERRRLVAGERPSPSRCC